MFDPMNAVKRSAQGGESGMKINNCLTHRLQSFISDFAHPITLVKLSWSCLPTPCEWY